MLISLLCVLQPWVCASADPTWSKEVAVRHGFDQVVGYQARIEDGYLIIKATHKKGWHTYAMDNELLAAAALNGKKSLGIEQGIRIEVESGLELETPWMQTEPKDFSNPNLRWYTYGFDQTALFACRLKSTTSERITLRIRGQACSGETCCQVDVLLKLQAVETPVDAPASTGVLASKGTDQIKTMLKGMVPVKTQSAPLD